MSPSQKQAHNKKDRTAAKSKTLFERIVRYLVSFPPYYLPIRIIGAVFLLLLVIGSGDLLSSTGIVLVLGILSYVLVIYLSKRFDDKD